MDVQCLPPGLSKETQSAAFQQRAESAVFSMFLHRVLPPPSALATRYTAGPPTAKTDTLLQSRVMPSRESSDSAEKTYDNRSSQRASSKESNDDPSSSPDQESLEEFYESRSPLSSSKLRLSRKRALSQDSREESRRLEREETTRTLRSLPSANTPSIGGSTNSICLCQPDPKIPRPRNAFILYRQAQQGSVVANFPGLANPEISKIIGEQWKNSSAETKTHWKELAEEEKRSHHRRYPDYRYQPRRAVKTNAAVSGSPSANSVETPRCSKCGGRSITTQNTGSTIHSTPHTPMTPHFQNLQLQSPSSRADRYSRPLDSPPVRTAKFVRRPGIPTSLQLTSPRRFPGEDANSVAYRDSSSAGRESKRRLLADGTYGPQTAGIRRAYHSSLPTPHNRESLPRVELTPRGKLNMVAPPRPRSQSFTQRESLMLPPLKNTQAKSVEAMVMSIPPLNKIKILAGISPPLSPPAPTSPARAIRGAVIAVEGADIKAVETVINYLSDCLTRESEHTVKVFESPSFPPSPGGEASFTDYLDLITQWHQTSQEIIEYITSLPSPPSPAPLSPKSKPQTRSKTSDTDHQSKMDMSPSPSSNSTAHPTPVALLLRYQLSQADAAASIIPIADNYAPVDHWGWMATLWRGMVGPDVTIVVRSALDIDHQNVKESGSPKEDPVDVKLKETGAIVLRCEKEGVVEDSWLRRVGFEVDEWVRVLARKDDRGTEDLMEQ